MGVSVSYPRTNILADGRQITLCRYNTSDKNLVLHAYLESVTFEHQFENTSPLLP